jgi:hypothetical protein
MADEKKKRTRKELADMLYGIGKRAAGDFVNGNPADNPTAKYNSTIDYGVSEADKKERDRKGGARQMRMFKGMADRTGV